MALMILIKRVTLQHFVSHVRLTRVPYPANIFTDDVWAKEGELVVQQRVCKNMALVVTFSGKAGWIPRMYLRRTLV